MLLKMIEMCHPQQNVCWHAYDNTVIQLYVYFFCIHKVSTLSNWHKKIEAYMRHKCIFHRSLTHDTYSYMY